MRYLFLLLVLVFGTVQAYPLEEIRILPEDVESVYDGDTMFVNIGYLPDVFGARLSIRTMGIDTPEMKSSCDTREQRDRERALAAQARDIIQDLVDKSKRIVLTQLDRDKYFRVDAVILIDGVNIGDVLIARGLARPYDGGTKVGWCNI